MPDPGSDSSATLDQGPGAGRLVFYVVLAAVLGGLFLGRLDLTPTLIAGLVLLWIVIAGVSSSVQIVQAYEKRALTVFGENRGLLDPGIHFVPPFVSRVYQYDMRTEALDVPSQEAITRDNSPVRADAVVYIRVMDAERAFLQVDDYRRATLNLAQTTLRAVIGDMELDETLSQRERINERIQDELAGPTDEWGIRVEAVEVREVKPSQAVQSAMEQQTAAERRRRAMILEAQGERRSSVERAEGEKQANIIRAEGSKQSQVLEAQGDALATVLRARAADSMGERAVIDRGMEALDVIGGGESTTFVLPQELTSLVGRYGKRLSGSDAGIVDLESTLEGREFDADERELLGLDDVEALAAGVPGNGAKTNGHGGGEGADAGADADPEYDPDSGPGYDSDIDSEYDPDA
ncbi:phosphoesterase [Halobacteriales archaeon QS_4_70_19]|nr:MAG: phosphoesterase [Halobacteriales archaeon QS_4_70_19]